jgi:hypothetical protein
MFRRNISPPFWGRKINQARNQYEACSINLLVFSSTDINNSLSLFNLSEKYVATVFKFSSLTNSSILNMDEAISSEISICFQLTAQLYTPEERTFHNRRCENLKFYEREAVFQKFKPTEVYPM